MGKVKVSVNFSRSMFNDYELAPFASGVLDSMTDNPLFPNPSPTLAVFKTILDTYISALVKAEQGTKAATAAKNNARVSVEDLLKKESSYVQIASDGDETAILSSGFQVNKKPAPVGELPKPQNVKIEVGSNKGGVTISCNAIKGARAYQYEYSKLPITADTTWVDVVTTRSYADVSGLESGKEYGFRVAGVGTDPTRVWSDVIASYVI